RPGLVRQAARVAVAPGVVRPELAGPGPRHDLAGRPEGRLAALGPLLAAGPGRGRAGPGGRLPGRLLDPGGAPDGAGDAAAAAPGPAAGSEGLRVQPGALRLSPEGAAC